MTTAKIGEINSRQPLELKFIVRIGGLLLISWMDVVIEGLKRLQMSFQRSSCVLWIKRSHVHLYCSKAEKG